MSLLSKRPKTTRLRMPRLAVIAVVVAPLLVTACSGGNALESPSSAASGSGTQAAPAGTLTVGGADFTEMAIMEHMYKLLLEEAGYKVQITSVASREIYLPSLEQGQVNVVPDYAATLGEYLNKEANGPDAAPITSNDAEATVAAITPLAQAKGLTLLEPAKAQDSNGFYVSKQFAETNNLKSLSDLGALGQPVTIAAGDECMARPFCAPGLTQTYGIQVTGVTGDSFGSLTGKQKVLNGQAQVGLTGTTDGTLPGLGLVLLQDDKKLQAADNLIPVVNTASASDPKIVEALDKLAPVLTTEDLAELNAKVDAQRQKPEDVAREYLLRKNLIAG